ncbi:MAG: hypothetical protein ACRD9S_00640 [Pyrinomonadaceae bacterium]
MARTQGQTIRQNEAGTIKSLRTLFKAETTYKSTTGNGDYGTLEELRKARMIDRVLAESHRYGYLFSIISEKPSSFEITAVPRTYGRTGRRSFYMDETGVIRAADKNGDEATAADRPL